jgi:predicted ATPase
VRERAGAALSLSSELGFPFWEWWALILSGWALAELSFRSADPAAAGALAQREEGLARMRRGIAGFERACLQWRPYWLALLAEAHARGGQYEEALGLLAEGLALAQGTGERAWEAELHRARGTSLLALSDPCRGERRAEAEAGFRAALEVARRQHARSLELRAATSLGGLLREQGRRDEARRILGGVVGWFTEDFDTADLREARALLATPN